jgi:hypothetical protein
MILEDVNNVQLLEGGEWNHERWWHCRWHKLIQVCRRWRYLVLGSALYLRLSLVCTRGTPVADMLAQSPPVPLIIDHIDDKYHDLTAEDEEGITLALHHRDRVRRIRLMKPIPSLQKLVTALDGEFPILEFLLIQHQRYHRPVTECKTKLELPETFRAPHLRQLVLRNFATPIDSPLPTTMGNLVTLFLGNIPSSAYFHPSALLQRLFLMPQLETLWIGFNLNRVEGQLLHTAPIMTRVTLPNLRWLGFRGANAYLEALLPWVTIPLLEKLQVYFFNQMIYSIPHLRQFMSTAGNLRPKAATFNFDNDCLIVTAYPHQGARMYTFFMEIGGRRLDWQMVSAAQVFHAPGTVLSAVEHLTLEYTRHNISSEWNDEADRTHWREFLGSFSNVKSLLVDRELVGQLSRALNHGEEESPTELLPELQELSYFAKGASRYGLSSFIDARRKAGRPVTVNIRW